MCICFGARSKSRPGPLHIGVGKLCIGRAEETEAHIAEALRQPARYMAYRWMNIAGLAKRLLGSWEQAVAWFRRSIEANRNLPYSNFHLAAALAQLGRIDEAHSAVKASLAVNPAFTISRVRASRTARTDDRTCLAQLGAFLRACARPEFPNNDRLLSRRARPLPAERRLRRREAGNRDADGGARDVVETRLLAERDRGRMPPCSPQTPSLMPGRVCGQSAAMATARRRLPRPGSRTDRP